MILIQNVTNTTIRKIRTYFKKLNEYRFHLNKRLRKRKKNLGHFSLKKLIHFSEDSEFLQKRSIEFK